MPAGGEPSKWTVKLYYTKRIADLLQIEANTKAEKEAKWARLEALEEQDRQKRFEIVDLVRKQMTIKNAKLNNTVVEDVAFKA